MEQQPHKNAAAASCSSSSGSSSSSSRSRSIIHGSMSSAFLGLPSPSPTTQSQSFQRRRSSSPSLYPPPLPPGHLASRGGSAASGASGSSSSPHQFFNNRQISHPSPEAGGPVRRRPRPSIQQRSSPFLSELSSIRRMGTATNLFGADGDLPNAQEMPMLHAQQQEQEMTRSSSSLTMSSHSSHQHITTILPSGEFAGRGFPSASQQPQAPQPSFSSLQPLPGGIFSGFTASPSQPSSSGSGFEWPSASQGLKNTYELAPLPSGIAYFQSPSTFSSDLVSGSGSSDAMYGYGHAQPSASESELPPLPPSLQIPPQYDLPPLGLGYLTQNNGLSTESTDFLQPPSNSSERSGYELPPLPESLQMPPPLLLQQVKQEPVVVGPCIEPQFISLDDDDDELSALVRSSFASPSIPMLQPTTTIDHSLQLGGGGDGAGGGLAAEGGGQPQLWEAMPTPARSMQDTVNNPGGSSRSSIPWNFDGSIMPMYSLSEQQAMEKLRCLLSVWSSTESSSSDQTMGSSVHQDWAGMPELANKFDMMSIGGSGTEEPWNYSSSAATTPVAAVPKLILGGMNRPGLPPRSPALAGAGTSSSMFLRRSTKEHFFSQAEMETINKDNRLKELFKIEPKRVKKILNNRVYAARLKVQEANQLKNLQSRADALKMECMSLSTQVQSHKDMIVNLKAENRQMLIKLKGLTEQDKLSKDLNNQLTSEIQRLKLLGPNANGIHHPKSLEMEGGSGSSANGLHQLMNSHAKNLTGTHQLQTQEHTPRLQLQQQPHQAVDDELMGQPQYP